MRVGLTWSENSRSPKDSTSAATYSWADSEHTPGIPNVVVGSDIAVLVPAGGRPESGVNLP
jgi:hypothetical protein